MGLAPLPPRVRNFPHYLDANRIVFRHPLVLLLSSPALTSLDVRFPKFFRAPGRLAEAHAPTARTLRFGIPIIPDPTSSWNKVASDARKF